MKSIRVYSFLLITLLSCSDKKEDDTSIYETSDSIDSETALYFDEKNIEVLELNQKASKLIQESEMPYNLDIRDSLLKSAIPFLDSAIHKTRNFYSAYTNLASVFIKLKQYDKAEEVLKALTELEEHPEGYFYLGLIYEKHGKFDLAQDRYEKALVAYDKYLRKPIATAMQYNNREILLLFLEGKQKALERIEEKLKKDTNNTSLLIDKQFILNFNRKEFIDSL